MAVAQPGLPTSDQQDGTKGRLPDRMSFELLGEQWFAVQVRARRERSTATLLTGKGYRTLLPTYACQQRRNGQESCAPLFPGYVFCQFDGQKRLPILITPGVIALVGRGRVPVPVEPSEIDAIQTMVASGLPLAPWPYMEVGQKVRIEDHALRGLEGILIAFKGRDRIVVSVSLLRRSVALEIDRALVSPVRSNRDAIVELLPSYELAIA
jgi:transcription termination/antitermination protein NusG